MIAWFLTTRIGRYAAAGGALAVAAGILVLRLLALGRQQERAAQTQSRLEAIKQRKTSDEQVDGLRPDDLDRRVNEWMRDGKG